MRKIIWKIKRIFKFIGVIIYFILCRIKNIGKPKGVAQVVEAFNSGGLEQVAANIYKAFNENGNASYVISLSNNVGPMCRQLESPKHLRIIYYDTIEMIRFCAKNNIGSLIYHFTTFHMILFKFLGFKNHYIIHNVYIWYTEKEWKTLKFKLKFCDSIIAVSKWCQSYFEKKTGITNIKIILNGINIKNLTNGENSSITRDSLNIVNNEIVILTLGAYTDGKHQMAIIGIAEKLLQQNKNVKFICAGQVLNPKLYKEFKKNLKKSKARKNIIVLDYIPQDEIGDFIRKNCDIYLQPSIHEAGVPLTVMEALLNGKPVVMTDFMIRDIFPVVDRIFPVKPPYDDELKLSTKASANMARKIYDNSTDLFVKALEEVIDNLNYYKDMKNFDITEYDFLSYERMAREYIEHIKL